jgi:hypothetical protein
MRDERKTEGWNGGGAQYVQNGGYRLFWKVVYTEPGKVLVCVSGLLC